MLEIRCFLRLDLLRCRLDRASRCSATFWHFWNANGSLWAIDGPIMALWDAFANRRQDYSQVVEDDELLGDGLDDEEGDV